MRILIAGTTYFPAMNGQAVFTVNLAQGLARSGHEVMVATHSEREYAYHEVRNGVHVEGIRSISLYRLHPDVYLPLFSGRDIRRIFDVFQPEVVHFQDHYPMNRALLQEAHRRGIKSIGTNHFMPENLAPYASWLSHFKTFFDWALWHWVLGVFNNLDAATAPSRTASSLLRAKGLKSIALPISNGIDLNRFRPNPAIDRAAICQRYALDPNKKIILFVGRVDHEKKVAVLINAMHKLTRDDVQLAIAGHGPAVGSLKALAENLHLGAQVKFLGFIPGEELPDLLNSVDVFAMPSEAELQSIATLEAMASGLPVLAARAVALPELVSDQVNGILFRPGDASDAARGIIVLLDNPELLYKMGLASLDKVQSHSLENTVHRYEALYETVLSGTVSTVNYQRRLRSIKDQRSSVANTHI